MPTTEDKSNPWYSRWRKKLSKEFRAWSLYHFIFDGFLTVLLTWIIGLMNELGFWTMLGLGACLGVVIVSGTVLFRQMITDLRMPLHQTQQARAEKNRQRQLKKIFDELIAEGEAADLGSLVAVGEWVRKVDATFRPLISADDMLSFSQLFGGYDAPAELKQRCLLWIRSIRTKYWIP